MHQTHFTLTPPNPHDAIKSYEGCRARAEQMLAEATTSAERLHAQFWIDSADRNLTKWRALAERGQR